MRQSPLLAVTGLAAMLSFATPAAAGDDYRFSYQPHELQTVGGAQNVYKRIELRASQSCQTRGRETIFAKRAAADCEAGMIENIVEEIDNARLNRVHANAKSKRRYASG